QYFFSDGSGSSKGRPAAQASIIAVSSSQGLRGPPSPASASATIGRPNSVSSPLGPRDLIGTTQRVVQAGDDGGDRAHRVERSVGIGVLRGVGVGGHLPAG